MFTAEEPLQLSSQERSDLQQVLRSTNLPAGIVRPARVLLLLADGASFRRIQAQTGMSPRRALAWKRNWQQKGMDGLLDAPRAGRPKRLTPGKEAAILAAMESTSAGSATLWSTRRIARQVGVSHVTVMLVWHKAGLRPHRLRQHMASPDPDFEDKVKDILGLYLNPPRQAAVFCMDEKTAIQALDRTQPALPLRLGRPERHSVEYVRHGTVSLFAALEVHTGKVKGRCAARHTGEAFVGFLDQAVVGRQRRQIHLILDDLAVHKTPGVQTWLNSHPMFICISPRPTPPG
jgi:transposase